MRIPGSHQAGRRDLDAGEMTAMIDVVFLLLIFFICAATGAVQESVLATDLAASGSVEAVAPAVAVDPIQIETWLKLQRDPDKGTLLVLFNDTEFSDLDQLETTLKAVASLDASNPVILDIAPDVTLGELVNLYDRCRRSGLQSINFATAPPT
ncbi:MAG: biopolymer transporter ExbD [Planctomycetaceae bacterium]